MKPDVARRQIDAEIATAQGERTGSAPVAEVPTGVPEEATAPGPALPKRFHGAVVLNPERVGRDASRIAEEVIAHLATMPGAEVTVTLEIEATLPQGASDHVVRIVTENASTLKFTNQHFEKE